MTINAGDNIQNAVNANPQGTTFIISPGLYRMQFVAPKDGDIFLGQTGAILNGSRLLTSFTQSGGYWIATGQTQHGMANGFCETLPDGTKYDGCIYPEDLFFDSKPLWHVGQLSEMGPGKWYFDYTNDVIYMFDNPTGHKIETSVLGYAIAGSANNVIIKNLIIEKYATPTNAGAIGNFSSGTGWQVSNSELRLNHAAGLYARSGWIVSYNYVHDNGQYGLEASGSGVYIHDNQIARNNYAGYDFGMAAGGTKFVRTTNLIVRNNYSHHNIGPGFWDDTDNIYELYENNIVSYNAGAGIMHEVSYDATIRYNLFIQNGLTPLGWLYDAQVFVSSGPNADIYSNLAVVPAGVDAWGNRANGITLIQQNRGSGAYGPHLTTGNHVHNNVITYLASVGQSGAAADYQPSVMYSGGNSFDYDFYHSPSIMNYRWTWNGNQPWAGFQAQGQEAHGSADTNVVPDDTLAPFAPTGLLAVAASQSQINLSWQAATDDVAIAGYRIYRNNAPIAFSLTPSFSDTGLQTKTTYTYSVAAVDTSGNISPMSGTVTGTTF